MGRTLSQRQETILREIRASAGISTYRLASIVDAPEASVRRDVGSLRKAGHDIEWDYMWGYTIHGDGMTTTGTVVNDVADTFAGL